MSLTRSERYVLAASTMLLVVQIVVLALSTKPSDHTWIRSVFLDSVHPEKHELPLYATKDRGQWRISLSEPQAGSGVPFVYVGVEPSVYRTGILHVTEHSYWLSLSLDDQLSRVTAKEHTVVLGLVIDLLEQDPMLLDQWVHDMPLLSDLRRGLQGSSNSRYASANIRKPSPLGYLNTALSVSALCGGLFTLRRSLWKKPGEWEQRRRRFVGVWIASVAVLGGQVWLLTAYGPRSGSSLAQFFPSLVRGSYQSYPLDVIETPTGLEVQWFFERTRQHPVIASATYAPTSYGAGFCNLTRSVESTHLWMIENIAGPMSGDRRAEVMHTIIDHIEANPHGIVRTDPQTTAEHMRQLRAQVRRWFNREDVSARTSEPILLGYLLNALTLLALYQFARTSRVAIHVLSESASTRNPMVCRACGYDLRGLSEASACPECGEDRA